MFRAAVGAAVLPSVLRVSARAVAVPSGLRALVRAAALPSVLRVSARAAAVPSGLRGAVRAAVVPSGLRAGARGGGALVLRAAVLAAARSAVRLRCAPAAYSAVATAW